MALYRKKPIMVEAHRWFKNGDHPEDQCRIIKDSEGNEFKSEGKVVRYYRHPYVRGDQVCGYCGHAMHDHGWIDTPEGGHTVCPGDYIIRGVNGEFYPCKPDIFVKTYEPVEGAVT